MLKIVLKESIIRCKNNNKKKLKACNSMLMWSGLALWLDLSKKKLNSLTKYKRRDVKPQINK